MRFALPSKALGLRPEAPESIPPGSATVRGHSARHVPDSYKMTDAGSKDPPSGSTRVSRTTWSFNPNPRYRQKVARWRIAQLVVRGIVYDHVREVFSESVK